MGFCLRQHPYQKAYSIRLGDLLMVLSRPAQQIRVVLEPVTEIGFLPLTV